MPKKKPTRGGVRVPGPGKTLGRPKKPDALSRLVLFVAPDVLAAVEERGKAWACEVLTRAVRA